MANKKSGSFMPAPMPRKEICDNPVKLCHEISRLSGARVRSANLEGIMSQHGARLVLSAIVAEDGASGRRITEITHLRPPTVSVILRKMQEEGMVELVPNPDDKRELRVFLTECGRAIDKKVIDKIKETDAIALDGLSESEYGLLMELLYRVRENLLCEGAPDQKDKKETME